MKQSFRLEATDRKDVGELRLLGTSPGRYDKPDRHNPPPSGADDVWIDGREIISHINRTMTEQSISQI